MHDEGTTVRYTVHVETTLEHPAEKVWPHILRWDAWIEDYREERVGGAPDAVGEVLRVSHFDETGRLDLSFFVSIFKITPHRQLVYKIISPLYSYDAETGAVTAAPTMGFEILNLREDGETTVIGLDAFIELTGPRFSVQLL